MLCGTSFVLTDENCVYLHTLKKCVEELVFGQKPYAISVRGGFTGVSELNTMLWSGKFQNGVINATYQAQFKIDGVIRNFKWRIQGAHI